VRHGVFSQGFDGPFSGQCIELSSDGEIFQAEGQWDEDYTPVYTTMSSAEENGEENTTDQT